MSGVSAYVNHVQNDGVENGTRFWTASGGTLTTTSTAGSGVLAGSWTPSAAAQTMSPLLKLFRGSDQNVNHEAGFMLQSWKRNLYSPRLRFKTDQATCCWPADDIWIDLHSNYYASGPGGTGSKSFALPLWRAMSRSFISMMLTLVKTEAQEPFHSQHWLEQLRSLDALQTFQEPPQVIQTSQLRQEDLLCGNWSGLKTPTTNVPAVRTRNQPGGKYLFKYTGQLKADAASDCAYRFSDGTNGTIEMGT